MTRRPLAKAGAVTGSTSTSDAELPYVPCSEDPELWFTTDENAMYRARSICLSECLPKVREACGRLALKAERDVSVYHRFGVFGGMDPAERRAAAKAARAAAAADRLAS